MLSSLYLSLKIYRHLMYQNIYNFYVFFLLTLFDEYITAKKKKKKQH